MPKLRAPYIEDAWQHYRRVTFSSVASYQIEDHHDAFFAGALAMFIAHRQLSDIELLRVEMETHARGVNRDWLKRISPAASLLT